jgi:hypothetical protein
VRVVFVEIPTHPVIEQSAYNQAIRRMVRERFPDVPFLCDTKPKSR